MVLSSLERKSGSWYSYNDTKLGQGRDAAKQCIQDNPELADTKEVSAEDDKAAVVQDEKKVSASKSKK